MIAVGVLAAYSYVIYKFDNSSKMGIVTSVSIVLMDFFLLGLEESGMVSRPATIISLLILNRALMIGMGSEYWIYGYMVLYLIYGTALATHSARITFPL